MQKLPRMFFKQLVFIAILLFLIPLPNVFGAVQFPGYMHV